jgi:hypothetical protein
MPQESPAAQPSQAMICHCDDTTWQDAGVFLTNPSTKSIRIIQIHIS